MKMCFPQKQVKKHLCGQPRGSAGCLRAEPSPLNAFCRFSVSDRLHLPRSEGVFAVFPDSRSHLLVSLQRDAGAGPAPPPQHALHTPHPLLQAARPAGSGGHGASAGPHHSPGTIEHKHIMYTFFTFPLFI